MISRDYKITGILLAGGRSKRMGSEKGVLRAGSRMLYQYPLQTLDRMCNELLISTCKSLGPDLPGTRVCDEIPDLGPMGGIYSCLRRSSHDLNVVLSYDMPLVNQEVLTELLDACEGYDIVVPSLDGGPPEPLCGIYRKEVADSMQRLIGKGILAVHKVFPEVRTRIVRMDSSMPYYHPHLFLNVNHPSDLEKLPSGFGEH
jgi:molybdopterin-guanine dinucleotide biosynthesis protein A